MSSNSGSPHRFSGTYDSFYNDASAAAAVNGMGKMHVPKRIRVTGENDDSPSVNWANVTKPEKLAMNVPERIMVAGGENHISSRGVPREVELEQSMMPKPMDPTFYRVNTPPRTITLNNYVPEREEETPSSPRSTSSRPTSTSGHHSSTTRHPVLSPFEEDSSPGFAASNALQSLTPSTLGGQMEDLGPGEEVHMLRRQVGRMNRRIMALEQESQLRSQREMIVYSIGVAYCVLRSILWFNKSTSY